jgi:hypothetical protein
MIRQEVIRQIVQRDQQQQSLSEDAAQRDAPDLYELACDTFGAWEVALSYAGVRRSRRKRATILTPDQVTNGIRCICLEGQDLKATRIAACDRPLYVSALKHFGNWRSAVQAAGLDPRRGPGAQGMDRQSIVSMIRQRHELGLALQRDLTMLQNPVLAKAAVREFGSWTSALQAAGFRSTRGRPAKRRQ